jgi:hypothetical protein
MHVWVFPCRTHRHPVSAVPSLLSLLKSTAQTYYENETRQDATLGKTVSMHACTHARTQWSTYLRMPNNPFSVCLLESEHDTCTYIFLGGSNNPEGT